MTQRELADKAGVNRSTIVRLEGGADEPLPSTLRKLASALEVEAADLVGAESGALPQALGLIGTNDDDVGRVLRKTPSLAELVREAMDQVRKFIPDAGFDLQLLIDPDDGDGGSEQLMLQIFTQLDDDGALAALRNFDRYWWLDHIGQGQGLLCIDLAFS